MLVLVTGSRSWTNRELVRHRLQFIHEPYDLMHGGAKGLDTIAGEVYKELTGKDAIVIRPDYNRYFYKYAPKMRNVEMVHLAAERQNAGEDVIVLGFKDLNSRTNGTQHCIDEAKLRSLPTEVIKAIAS